MSRHLKCDVLQDECVGHHLRASQIIYNIFYLLRRPEGRKVSVLVYAHLLWLGP